MLKIFLTLLLLASAGLAQTSSEGSFAVRHAKHATFRLSSSQMHEAESLYENACAIVQHDFHSADRVRPHFTVVVGTDRNEVHSGGIKVDNGLEIWMKKWNPRVFVKGVVILAFQQLLTEDMITQLSNRAVRYSNATVDVTDLD